MFSMPGTKWDGFWPSAIRVFCGSTLSVPQGDASFPTTVMWLSDGHCMHFVASIDGILTRDSYDSLQRKNKKRRVTIRAFFQEDSVSVAKLLRISSSESAWFRLQKHMAMPTIHALITKSVQTANRTNHVSSNPKIVIDALSKMEYEKCVSLIL